MLLYLVNAIVITGKTTYGLLWNHFNPSL